MTPPLVIDASVAVKWLIPEIDSEQAIALLESGSDLYAPVLLASEIGNVLWKMVRKKSISSPAAQRLMASLMDIRLRWVDGRSLAPATLDIACRHDRSYYDSLYLALAQAINGTLVTADERFANAFAGTLPGKRIVTLSSIG